jgi:hypothetical protein
MSDKVAEVEGLIIDAPNRKGGYVNISPVKPDNPLIISGTSVTVGKDPETLDIKAKLDVLKEAGDAFMVGAGYGYTLGHDVFGDNKQELSDVAAAFVSAEKGLLDATFLGRSEGPIRVAAMREMTSFYDERNKGIELRKSYYERRKKYLDKAYSRWEPKILNAGTEQKPPRETFDTLANKLVTVRKIIAGESLPVLPEDLAENKVVLDNDENAKAKISAGYQDGFKRAFESVAETHKTERGFEEKYWYLK